jgi:hypothetical protein
MFEKQKLCNAMQLTPHPQNQYSQYSTSQKTKKKAKAKLSNGGHEKDGLQTAIMHESKPISLHLVI